MKKQNEISEQAIVALTGIILLMPATSFILFSFLHRLSGSISSPANFLQTHLNHNGPTQGSEMIIGCMFIIGPILALMSNTIFVFNNSDTTKEFIHKKQLVSIQQPRLNYAVITLSAVLLSGAFVYYIIG
jgi:hypothetical protein